MVSHFNNRSDFSWNDVIQLEKRNLASLLEIAILRDEGAITSKGQKLWKELNESFLEKYVYQNEQNYSFQMVGLPIFKSKGCSVWDLDGKKLEDVSVMELELTCWVMEMKRLIVL